MGKRESIARRGGEEGGIGSREVDGSDCAPSHPEGARPLVWRLTYGTQMAHGWHMGCLDSPAFPSSILLDTRYLLEPPSPTDAKINSQQASLPQGLCTGCSCCSKYLPYHKTEFFSSSRSQFKYCFLINVPPSCSLLFCFSSSLSWPRFQRTIIYCLACVSGF